MRYMGTLYANMTEYDLRVLRSKKYNRISSLRHQPSTYLNMQELKKLIYQLNTLDAELRSRKDQLSLDL